MNTKLALALVALSLGAPSLALAQTAPAQTTSELPAQVPLPQGRFRVTIGPHVAWQLDRGWDAVMAPTEISGPELNVSADLVGHATRFVLAAEVGYRNGSFQSSTFSSVTTRGTFHTPYGGISARFVPTQWFQPYVRATAGAGYTGLRFEPLQELALEGSAWGFVASGGLGIMVSTGPFTDDRRFSRFELVGGIEGGVLAGTASSFTLRPDVGEAAAAEADRLDQRSVNLGTVAPHAGYLRLSIGLRF